MLFKKQYLEYFYHLTHFSGKYKKESKIFNRKYIQRTETSIHKNPKRF